MKIHIEPTVKNITITSCCVVAALAIVAASVVSLRKPSDSTSTVLVSYHDSVATIVEPFQTSITKLQDTCSQLAVRPTDCSNLAFSALVDAVLASARVERLPKSAINSENQELLITAFSKYAVAMKQLTGGASYRDSVVIEKAADLTQEAAKMMAEALQQR